MIKGSTRIELTDVNTGEKHVIEENNMVTNAFENLCKPCGYFGSPIFYMMRKDTSNTADKIVNSVFGGIMLFDSALNDNKDDYLFPSENIGCTGYAKENVVYNGTNLMAGSYNIGESGVQDDGSYKHVYEFTTNQANGTIGSVCIVPKTAAGIGLLNKNVDNMYGNNRLYQMDTTTASILHSDFIEKFWLFPIACIKNCMYAFRFDSSNVNGDLAYNIKNDLFKIYKYRYPVTDASILDEFYGFDIIEDEITLKIPDEIKSSIGTYANMSYGFYDGILRIVIITSSTKSFNNGDEIQYIEVNFNDGFKITLRKTINNSGERINISNGNVFYKNYILLHGSTNVTNVGYKNYIQNLSDATDIKYLSHEDGTAALLRNGESFVMFGDYIINNGCTEAVNIKTGKAYKINTAGNNSIGCSNSDYAYIDDIVYIGVLRNSYSGNISSTFYRHINPYLLMTKNNLSSPVEKTAQQTMKITYTLSEVAG